MGCITSSRRAHRRPLVLVKECVYRVTARQVRDAIIRRLHDEGCDVSKPSGRAAVERIIREEFAPWC